MTATTKPVDIFGILDTEIKRAGGKEYPACRDLMQARAAIAELIAADVEYDEAHSAYSKAPGGIYRNDAWDRVLYAERRRASALKAIQGENGGSS